MGINELAWLIIAARVILRNRELKIEERWKQYDSPVPTRNEINSNETPIPRIDSAQANERDKTAEIGYGFARN